MMEYVVDTVGAANDRPPGRTEARPEQRARAGGVDRAEHQRQETAPRAVVGGVDYAVGGWGEYEVNRRRARWEATKTGGAPERASKRYKDRTYIGAADAVQSILGGSRAVVGGSPGGRAPSALQRAALRLSDTLGRLEDRLCDPDDEGVWECEPATALRPTKAARVETRYLTIPPVTSADLRAFAEDPLQESDPDAIYDLGEDVLSLAAATGTVLPPLPELVGRERLPPLPSRVVPVTDEEGVLRLETATLPYVAGLESLQASLATRLDAAATAIDEALAKRSPKAK